MNKQDLTIQYAIEYEDRNSLLNSVNIDIASTSNEKYEFKLYHEDPITNIYEKAVSYVLPHTIKSICKHFLHRSRTIWSEKLTKNRSSLMKCLPEMDTANHFSKT